jgi:uncharacterized membrane protein
MAKSDEVARARFSLTAGRRAAIAFVLGVVGGVLIAFVAPWQVAVVSGWDVAGLFLLVVVWTTIRRLDAVMTQSHATREDDSRVAAGLLLVGASVASLAATGLDLVKASHATGFHRFLLTSTAILTVTVSWAVVHTVYTLRYAHEYYMPPIGGIDFKTNDEAPDYRDFAYVAFTVGMTFQVSDTDIQRRQIRRSVLTQALLAYLFGAVILAVTINVVASLFQ